MPNNRVRLVTCSCAAMLGREVAVTQKAAENIRQLRPIRRKALGSVVGTLEAISIHRSRKFVVYHAMTKKAVDCIFSDDETLSAVKDMLGYRVNVSGIVHFNIKGEPVRIETEGIRVLPSGGTLRAKDLAGSHPDITEGMSLEDYMRSIRGE